MVELVGKASRNENRDKLPQLLELKYHNVRDAVEQLGSVKSIGEVFIGFLAISIRSQFSSLSDN